MSKTKETNTELLKKEKIQTYTYDEVLSSSIKYFNGDELAATTWMNKYAMKDFNDNYVEQNPSDMHRRMAKEFGRIEEDYKLKYNLNGSAKFLSEYGQKREHLSEGRIFDLFENFGYYSSRKCYEFSWEYLQNSFSIKLYCGSRNA